MTDPPRPAPSQTVGPVLRVGLLREHIGSTVVPADDPRAIRHPRHGCSTAPASPVPDGIVEIWQANVDGRYAHPDDARRTRSSRLLRLRPLGDRDDGRFAFVTVKPGRCRGPTAAAGPAPRRPHVRARAAQAARHAHLLRRRGGGERDRSRPRRADAERPTLIAQRRGRRPRFDIVIQGGARRCSSTCERVRAALRPGRTCSPPSRLGPGSGDARLRGGARPRRGGAGLVPADAAEAIAAACRADCRRRRSARRGRPRATPRSRSCRLSATPSAETPRATSTGAHEPGHRRHRGDARRPARARADLRRARRASRPRCAAARRAHRATPSPAGRCCSRPCRSRSG